MSGTRILERLQTQPFQPFRLRMADGEAVMVERRDWCGVSPKGRTVVVFGADDRMAILDTRLVARLEPWPPRRRGKKGQGL